MPLSSQVPEERARAQILVENSPRAAVQVNKGQPGRGDSFRWLSGVALQLLATVVAFIGILSTLMSLQLERMREIGVLRSTGMTRRQLWKLSLLETRLVGSTAGLLAMPTGFVFALVLITSSTCTRLAGRWRCSYSLWSLYRRFLSRW
ncbi:MAG: ABC transporter permease [Caldilinea sp.]